MALGSTGYLDLVAHGSLWRKTSEKEMVELCFPPACGTLRCLKALLCVDKSMPNSTSVRIAFHASCDRTSRCCRPRRALTGEHGRNLRPQQQSSNICITLVQIRRAFTRDSSTQIPSQRILTPTTTSLSSADRRPRSRPRRTQHHRRHPAQTPASIRPPVYDRR